MRPTPGGTIVRVSVTPRLGGAASKGDTRWYRVSTIGGWVWLWLSGRVASQVVVTVRAPAVPGYTAYRSTTTYTTTRVR